MHICMCMQLHAELPSRQVDIIAYNLVLFEINSMWVCTVHKAWEFCMYKDSFNSVLLCASADLNWLTDCKVHVGAGFLACVNMNCNSEKGRRIYNQCVCTFTMYCAVYSLLTFACVCFPALLLNYVWLLWLIWMIPSVIWNIKVLLLNQKVSECTSIVFEMLQMFFTESIWVHMYTVTEKCQHSQYKCKLWGILFFVPILNVFACNMFWTVFITHTWLHVNVLSKTLLFVHLYVFFKYVNHYSMKVKVRQ